LERGNQPVGRTFGGFPWGGKKCTFWERDPHPSKKGKTQGDTSNGENNVVIRNLGKSCLSRQIAEKLRETKKNWRREDFEGPGCRGTTKPFVGRKGPLCLTLSYLNAHKSKRTGNKGIKTRNKTKDARTGVGFPKGPSTLWIKGRERKTAKETITKEGSQAKWAYYSGKEDDGTPKWSLIRRLGKKESKNLGGGKGEKRSGCDLLKAPNQEK